jgi:hypothetical protein
LPSEKLFELDLNKEITRLFTELIHRFVIKFVIELVTDWYIKFLKQLADVSGRATEFSRWIVPWGCAESTTTPSTSWESDPSPFPPLVSFPTPPAPLQPWKAQKWTGLQRRRVVVQSCRRVNTYVARQLSSHFSSLLPFF